MRKLPALVDTFMVIGVLRHCALLFSVCDLKATQMNMQYSLIWELVFYEFELGHNATEAAQNISMRSEGEVDHHTVTGWFKKFHLCR